ncbi:hypothetical protein JXR93_10095 [bacterium]|nr:hypothetical protein [bacterium]
MGKYLSSKEEANLMMRLFPNWTECYKIINHHFDVLQSRNQMMLTLSTLTLTITGFSGPKIASDNTISRVFLILGLSTVLLSTIIILLSTLKIRWLTQNGVEEPIDILISLIDRRNKRTKLFHLQLITLMGGLFFYVSGVIVYLFIGHF